jgi:hypothetical protein
VPRSSKWSSPIRLFIPHFMCFFHACYMPWLSHHLWFHHPVFWWIVQIMELLIVRCSPVFCDFTSLLSRYSPPLFTNSLNLCYSLNVRDEVTHPYKTTDKLLLVYFNILFCLLLKS